MDTRFEKQRRASELLGRRELPTCKILNPNRPGRFLIINLEDFDPHKHHLWAGEAERIEAERRALDVA